MQWRCSNKYDCPLATRCQLDPRTSGPFEMSKMNLFRLTVSSSFIRFLVSLVRSAIQRVKPPWEPLGRVCLLPAPEFHLKSHKSLTETCSWPDRIPSSKDSPKIIQDLSSFRPGRSSPIFKTRAPSLRFYSSQNVPSGCAIRLCESAWNQNQFEFQNWLSVSFVMFRASLTISVKFPGKRALLSKNEILRFNQPISVCRNASATATL